MNTRRNEFAEFQELLDLVCEDRANSEQLNRVQEIAQGSPAAMQFYVDYLDQHSRLLWRFRRFAIDASGDLPPSCPIAFAESSGVTVPIDSLPGSMPLAGDSPSAFSQSVSLPDSGAPGQGIAERFLASIIRPFRQLPVGAADRRRFAPAAIAVCFGLICFTLGAAAIRWIGAIDHSAKLDDRGMFARGSTGGSQTASQNGTTLINVTNCLWDSANGMSSRRDGSEIRPGQSLNLVEGIAEIVSSRPAGGSDRFVLEGPLAMVVVADSATMLHYGKLFAAVAPQGEPFTLGTPLGQLIVEGNASIGIVAANQSVALHVFSGEATFELLWAESSLDEQRRFDIRAGSSLRLVTNSAGKLKVDRGVANDRCFAVSVSMADSRFNLTNKYVEAIGRASPLIYWRFESIDNGFVRNEIDDRWHGRVQGAVGSRDYLGNRSGEFGIGQSTGYLVTDDNLGDLIGDSYSIEAWVKPSHIHSGTLVGLINWSQERPLLTEHGALLSLTGPAGPWAQVKPESLDPPKSPSHFQFNPERVRFLHRQPVGRSGGVDCYSNQSYDLRKWQHYVCVKDSAAMRLYVDGKLAGQVDDETTLPPGLRLIIGQLYPSNISGHSVFRQFVGEIDEVAFYDRALDEDEIVSHFQIGSDDKSAVTARP